MSAENLPGLSYQHLQYTAGDRPLNGLLHVSTLPSRGTSAAVHIHGMEGKFLGGNPFVTPLVKTLGDAGISTLLAERGGTGEKYWIGGQKLGASQETMESAVEDTWGAMQALEELEYDSIFLSGFSLGATIAAATAAKYPKHVSAVALLSPTLMPDWLVASDSRHPGLARRAARLIAVGEPTTDVVSDHRGYGTTFSAAAYHSLSHATLGPHLQGLADERIPTLAVYGTADNSIAASYGPGTAIERYIQDNNAASEVHQIEGAGHDFAGFEREICELMRGFIQK